MQTSQTLLHLLVFLNATPDSVISTATLYNPGNVHLNHSILYIGIANLDCFFIYSFDIMPDLMIKSALSFDSKFDKQLDNIY
jgi:hypothetical protein